MAVPVPESWNPRITVWTIRLSVAITAESGEPKPIQRPAR